jgi:hypothetical protein
VDPNPHNFSRVIVFFSFCHDGLPFKLGTKPKLPTLQFVNPDRINFPETSLVTWIYKVYVGAYVPAAVLID